MHYVVEKCKIIFQEEAVRPRNIDPFPKQMQGWGTFIRL